MLSLFLKSLNHQIIKSSNHQIIKSSNHQITEQRAIALMRAMQCDDVNKGLL